MDKMLFAVRGIMATYIVQIVIAFVWRNFILLSKSGKLFYANTVIQPGPENK